MSNPRLESNVIESAPFMVRLSDGRSHGNADFAYACRRTYCALYSDLELGLTGIQAASERALEVLNELY